MEGDFSGLVIAKEKFSILKPKIKLQSKYGIHYALLRALN
jgi:hypothetical protein